MDLLFKYLKLILFLTQLDHDQSKRTACLTEHNIRQQAGKKTSYTGSQQKKLSPPWGNLLKGTSFTSKSRKNNKHKLRNLGALTLLAVIGSLLFPTSAKAVTTTLNFSDTAPTLVSGTALTQGAVYRFKNVASGVDALVTIATVSNATLTNIDDNTNPSAAFASRFQPIINHTSAVNTTSYIRFNFQLVVAGTTTPTSVTNVYFSAQDVDGGGANTIREFVEVIGAQATYIPTPTLLQTMASLPVAGGVGYEQISAANTQTGIGTDDNYELYSYMGNSVSSFTIIGGNINGSTGCSGAACPRQNSWTFDVADVQRLDFGDAPSTYGDAYHAVPPAPTVYLGTTPIVDGDDGPNYSATANGDDTTGTDDENGVATFSALTQTATSYSVTASCTGANAVVAAWIDFNRNGTFETTERTTGTCNNTSVTLNWTGLNGISAGATFARLRIGTTASQISTSTGIASNGEVEDYPLTIAAVPGTISGSLYRDANNDNAFTTGETKLPANIDVELVNSTGTVVGTVQTNATGDYTFANVPAGTGYQVRVVTSDPQIPTGFVIGTTNPITGISVTAGATVANQNFGFDATYNISGTLYQDANGSNVFDSGETRLPANITVTLYNDANANNTIDTGEQVGSPVTTNATGDYTFTGVLNGTYKIKVDTADSDITSRYAIATSNDLTATVNGANLTSQNFGFVLLPSSFGSCSASPYISYNSPNTLGALNVSTLSLDPIGNSTFPYNAIGYNIVNDLIYGIRRTTAIAAPYSNSNELVVIGSNGVAVNLGVVNGLPLLTTNSLYNSGDVASNSNYFVVNGLVAAKTFYRIDINPASPTYKQVVSTFSLPAPYNTTGYSFGDIAFNPVDGQIYAVLNTVNATTGAITAQQLARIAPSSGSVTLLGAATLSDLDSFIGLFVDNQGNIYGYQGTAGKLWRYSSTTGTRVLVKDGLPTANNNADGARCYNSPAISSLSERPQVLLVKRITAVDSTTYNTFRDDPSDQNDNNTNWPSSFVVGEYTAPDKAKPGSIVEYTIYFLSTGGSNARNASICDLIPANTTFVPDTFTTGKGIQQASGTATPVALTNISDTDAGQFYSATETAPTVCRVGQTVTNGNGTFTPTNVNGAVVVNLGTVTTKTNDATKYYGYLKFRAKVN